MHLNFRKITLREIEVIYVCNFKRHTKVTRDSNLMKDLELTKVIANLCPQTCLERCQSEKRIIYSKQKLKLLNHNPPRTNQTIMKVFSGILRLIQQKKSLKHLMCQQNLFPNLKYSFHPSLKIKTRHNHHKITHKSADMTQQNPILTQLKNRKKNQSTTVALKFYKNVTKRPNNSPKNLKNQK